MFIQCSGDIWHSYSTQASKLSFVVVHWNLGVPYVLMASVSVWNVIRLDGSFSCCSCPGSVRCSDYHFESQNPGPLESQTILTVWIESTSVSLQQKVDRDSTWQWKILAEQLYVCLIDSSSVFHLCGWEWPCGSICALCFRLPSFGHSVIWLWAHLHQGLKEMLENISGIITIKTKETADLKLNKHSNSIYKQ